MCLVTHLFPGSCSFDHPRLGPILLIMARQHVCSNVQSSAPEPVCTERGHIKVLRAVRHLHSKSLMVHRGISLHYPEV